MGGGFTPSSPVYLFLKSHFRACCFVSFVCFVSACVLNAPLHRNSMCKNSNLFAALFSTHPFFPPHPESAPFKACAAVLLLFLFGVRRDADKAAFKSKVICAFCSLPTKIKGGHTINKGGGGE